MTFYEINYELEWIEEIGKGDISFSERKYFIKRIKDIIRLELSKFDNTAVANSLFVKCWKVIDSLEK